MFGKSNGVTMPVEWMRTNAAATQVSKLIEVTMSNCTGVNYGFEAQVLFPAYEHTP